MAEDERDQGSGIGGANAAFPRYAVADPLAANALRGVARLGPQQRDAAAVEALRLRNRPDIAPHPLPKLALPHAVQKQQPVAAAGPKQKIDDKVNPVIKPDKLTVVVRKFHKDPAGKNRPYTNPKRQAVVLSTDTVFDGTGTFTRSSDRIKFFKSTSGSDEIKFNGKDNVFKGAQLTAGITVFAEATKPSDAPEDVSCGTAAAAPACGRRP